MAGAFAKIEGHEQLCAERYANIHSALGDIKGEQRMVRNAAFGLVVAMIGWMAVQLYDSMKPRPAPATASVIVSQPAQTAPEPAASR